MIVHNNTDFPLAYVDELPIIGNTVNKWRGRNILLRQHPTQVDKVVSDSVTFDGKIRVIATETRGEWATALDYISRGKIYISN